MGPSARGARHYHLYRSGLLRVALSLLEPELLHALLAPRTDIILIVVADAGEERNPLEQACEHSSELLATIDKLKLRIERHVYSLVSQRFQHVGGFKVRAGRVAWTVL